MGLNAAILDYHVDASKPMGISMEIQLSAAEDGLAAIRYLRSHADEYGIPTDKIAIGGMFDFEFSEQAKQALNDPIRNIHPDYPPMSVFQTHADDPRHALKFCYEFVFYWGTNEIYTFEEGPHGGALYDGKHEDSPYFPHTARWASLALEWLEDKGF